MQHQAAAELDAYFDVATRVMRYVIAARRRCACSQAIDRSEIEEWRRR